MEELKISITPLNEGQELNYNEEFTGTMTELLDRCKSIQVGLQKILTKGSFSVMLTNWDDDGKNFIYSDGVIYDENGDKITLFQQKLIA